VYTLSGLTFAGFSIEVSADNYTPVAKGVALTSGVTTLTLDFQIAWKGPRTQFGTGQWKVNTDIAAGRFFTDPNASGCYWERQSGFGGSLAEIIANDFISANTNQAIVDILGSDLGFKTQSACGSWSLTPKSGPPSGKITAGTWLVGSQLPPGTYSINAGPGCYWERLRNFQGVLGSIVANNFSSGGGTQIVTISGSDVGFTSDADCGTWGPSFTTQDTIQRSAVQSPDEIQAARDAHSVWSRR